MIVMTVRRVAICMALAACIAVVSPVWGERYHSHLLPGDLRPAAEALGVDAVGDYYTMADLLDALLLRVDDLESTATQLTTENSELMTAYEDLAAEVGHMEQRVLRSECDLCIQTLDVSAKERFAQVDGIADAFGEALAQASFAETPRTPEGIVARVAEVQTEAGRSIGQQLANAVVKGICPWLALDLGD